LKSPTYDELPEVNFSEEGAIRHLHLGSIWIQGSMLMDEPTAGMSPEETKVMMDLIVALAAERSVILVEHKMKLVMGICERLLVLHHGEFLAEGTPDDIRANAEVRRVYLGQH
jgi:branched-chain amino acid transport system ATP-binding protein